MTASEIAALMSRTSGRTNVLGFASLAENILSLRGAGIIIDASHVERLGGQSLQILLSALATWHADGFSLEFVRPSAPFLEGLALFGMGPEALLNGTRAVL